MELRLQEGLFKLLDERSMFQLDGGRKHEEDIGVGGAATYFFESRIVEIRVAGFEPQGHLRGGQELQGKRAAVEHRAIRQTG